MNKTQARDNIVKLVPSILRPFTTTEAQNVGFDFSLPILEEKRFAPKPPKTLYVFIRTGSYDMLSQNKKRGKPVGVIAYQIEQTKKGYKIKYGISVHNPVDCWDRNIGRAKAERRFRKPDRKAQWASGTFNSAETMTNAAMSDFFSFLETSNVPTRIRKCMYSMRIQYWRFHREDMDRAQTSVKSEKRPVPNVSFLH